MSHIDLVGLLLKGGMTSRRMRGRPRLRLCLPPDYRDQDLDGEEPAAKAVNVVDLLVKAGKARKPKRPLRGRGLRSHPGKYEEREHPRGEGGKWKEKPRWDIELSNKPDEQWKHGLHDAFRRVLNRLPAAVRDRVNTFITGLSLSLGGDGRSRASYTRFTGHIRISMDASDGDIVHEIGHALDHSFVVGPRHPGGGQIFPGSPQSQFWSRIHKPFQQAWRADVRDLGAAGREEWDYQAKNDEEAFATAFARHHGHDWEGWGGKRTGFAKRFKRTMHVVKFKLRQEKML